jgi:hypothetical protein
MKVSFKISASLITILYAMSSSVVSMSPSEDWKDDGSQMDASIPLRLSAAAAVAAPDFVRAPAPEEFNNASVTWSTSDVRHRSPNPEIADHFVNRLTATVSIKVDEVVWVGKWSYINPRATLPLDPWGDYKKVLKPFERANPPIKVQVDSTKTILSCVYNCTGKYMPYPFTSCDDSMELRMVIRVPVTVRQAIQGGVPGFEVQDRVAPASAAAASVPVAASAAAASVPVAASAAAASVPVAAASPSPSPAGASSVPQPKNEGAGV